MKLVRFGNPGCERPGVWVDNENGPAILDIRALAFDIEDFNRFFFTHDGPDRVARLLQEEQLPLVSADQVRLGPPVAPGGSVFCVGRNYVEHVREFGGEVPERPQFFLKASRSLIGPHDPIVLPPEAAIVDMEAELAVVIGTPAYRVEEEDAHRVIAGYLLFNDVTDRKVQREDGQWFRGKSYDTFGPAGPWLVTPDEMDPRALPVRSWQDGFQLQDGNTSDMLFNIPTIIAALSQTMTLHPGDILSTGTPSGIGSARTPPILLQPGSTVEAEIPGLGRQCNPVQALAV